MGDEKISCSILLANAMREAGCPEEMIVKAEADYYHDFKSPLAAPCLQLADDLLQAGKHELRERHLNGEFDAKSWEADEWAATPDGIEVFGNLFRGKR